MNVRRVAWRIVLGLAVVAGLDASYGDEPPAPGTEAPKAPAESKPLAPDADDPVEKPTNLADYTFSLDETIQLFELRVKVNPRDHTSFATLGDLYERKARETDDLTGFARAETAIRKALELFPGYTRAKVALAGVLCDRHKFGEALEIAQAVARENPKNIDALATVGDTQLELGRYAEAERSIRELDRRVPEAGPVLARLARLEELKGRADEALEVLDRAARSMRKANATAEEVAWYQFRKADILFNAGRIDDSGKAAEEVLKAVPNHHDATASLARVRAAQGRTAEAIALYEKAVAIAPDPLMLVALGDLYAISGDPTRARANYDRMERAVVEQPEHRRVLAYFYADHDRDLPRALELARQDFAQRQDIYGSDALAWALLKNGRVDEASKAIADALKLGTRDARLLFHAGMIYQRLGDPSKARDYLGQALALNPRFSPIDAELARKTAAEPGR